MKTAISRNSEKSEDFGNLLKKIIDLKAELAIAESLLEKNKPSLVDELKLCDQLDESHSVKKHMLDATLWGQNDIDSNVADSRLVESKKMISKIQHSNYDGEILNSIDESILADIVNDFHELLGTTTSLIEKSGDCALNLSSSEWCRTLDTASKNLRKGESCKENPENWLCNDFCRKGALENVNRSGTAVEFSCAGGLNVFAVPVRACKEIIGAISIAYGDAPKDDKNLERISKDFGINQNELRILAEKYESHPDFIIELAKSRLHLSAHLIGTIVERKRVETVLQKTNAEIEKRVDSKAAALKRSYNLLKEETKERLRAEKELTQRNKALESVYAMSTSFGVSLGAISDQVVQSISNIIQVPFVASSNIEKNELSFISEFNNKELTHKESIAVELHSCGIPFQEKCVFQRSGILERIYPDIKELRGMRAYVGVPVLSSKGKIIGSICLADKKEREFGEYELHLVEIFARYLGHEIERRSIERQLLQSQEMKMLGQLTSGVAHEVRNPLNGILAITDALSKDLGENSEYKIYIEHIRKQVTRLSGLMRDLLDLGRPMENSNLQPTSCIWLVSSAVNIWQHSSLFKDHRIRMIYNEDAEKLTVKIDRTKIEQVIINLLENACAHCPSDSEVVINIEPEGESLVLFRIIDKGSGIKPEHFEHLFEPFFTTRKGGTGLGLGIVKRIVESHGGIVEIWNNNPPPGVTVEFRLPSIPGN
jgi:signal transduction histidine kinase/ligand-binding sensor protein